jgi:2-polyprenyl-3-methyl-5-hydroxy-6-metoxy-1,4-benzoquinol methylase
MVTHKIYGKRKGARLKGLERTYRQARYLASVARSRWFAKTEQVFDQISVTSAWDYLSQPERERHQRVLACVSELRGNQNWGSALELGCYDGVFTQQLATRCTEVLACDISPRACSRTCSRCASLPQVRTERLNIEVDKISGTYDLIFAMDILNFVYGRDKMLKVSSTLASILKEDGLLVITDCRLAPYVRNAWFRFWVPVGGDNIVRLFASCTPWCLLRSEFHPDSGEDIGSEYMAHVLAFFKKGSKGRCER